MDWRLKALVQKSLAGLPEPVAQPLYFKLQRSFGGLRDIDPRRHLRKGAALAQMIRRLGRPLRKQRLVEIGTGWALTVPLALWLCGAKEIVTTDVHRYLQPSLVLTSLRKMQEAPDEVVACFGALAEHPIFQRRLRQLEGCALQFEALVELTGIRYLAPVDTANLPLEENTVDVHYSTNVFEHVPSCDLRAILREAKRLLAPDGLTIHRIDLSDHCAHADPSISAIHFLRFTERQWHFWSGNRFAYHNRMRASAFDKLFQEAGVQVLLRETSTDATTLEYLRNGFPLAPRFSSHAPEDLATTFMNIAGPFS